MFYFIRNFGLIFVVVYLGLGLAKIALVAEGKMRAIDLLAPLDSSGEENMLAAAISALLLSGLWEAVKWFRRKPPEGE